jgi:hypothetical protein
MEVPFGNNGLRISSGKICCMPQLTFYLAGFFSASRWLRMKKIPAISANRKKVPEARARALVSV